MVFMYTAITEGGGEGSHAVIIVVICCVQIDYSILCILYHWRSSAAVVLLYVLTHIFIVCTSIPYHTA